MSATAYDPAEMRRSLLVNGYTPIPIPLGGKRPVEKRWTTLSADAMQNWPGHNTGLRCDGLLAVDIDCLDLPTSKALVALTRKHFGETKLQRVGKYPKAMLVYRLDGPDRGKTLSNTYRLHGEDCQVEIFNGPGCQFVAFGQHPDTSKPYRWNGVSPEDVPYSELPAVTYDRVEAFIADAERLIETAGAVLKTRSSGGAGGERAKRNSALWGYYSEQMSALLALSELDLRAELEARGYDGGPDRYARPGATGAAGARILTGSDNVERVCSSNSGDPLNEYGDHGFGRTLNVVEVIAVYNYDCDLEAAIRQLCFLHDIGLPDPYAPANHAPGDADVEFASILKDAKRYDLKPWGWRAGSAIAPRPWVYGDHYIRRYLTATFAPGAVGKSSLAIVEALDMVTRKGLLSDNKIHDPAPLRVWYHNGEDPLDEIDRRVAAVCEHYGITAEDIGDRLIVTSGRTCSVIVAREDQGRFCIQQPDVDGLRAAMKDHAIDVLILDPFVTVHEVSENDNSQIGGVAKVFAGLAEDTNAAVELIHHTRKGGTGAGADKSVDDGRGAGALGSAARSVRVLNRMSPEEASKIGFNDDARLSYFRVDRGEKANMAPPAHKATWRHMTGVCMENARDGRPNDWVGVAEAWTLPTPKDMAAEAMSPDRIEALHDALRAGKACRKSTKAEDWVGHTLAAILGWNVETDRKRLAKLIEELIRAAVLADDTGTDVRRKPVPVVVPGNVTRLASAEA